MATKKKATPKIKKAPMRAEITDPTESEKTILSLVVRSGGLSQPDIAKKSEFSQQSVSRLVNGLIERGALYEGARKSEGRRGQPSRIIEIAPDYAYSFGVAIMTDAISVSLLDFSGVVLEQDHCAMTTMTRTAVISELKNIFAGFVKKRRISKKRIIGVGVGISGYSLGGHGRYNTPRTLDDWALVDIEQLLQEQLGFPVWVENDGNAASIGESLVGAGRTYDNFAYIFFSTGIGGGVVINHELMRGMHGNAGEIGLLLPRGIYTHPNLELLRQLVANQGTDVSGISEMLEKFDPDWPAVDEWIARARDSLSLIVSSLAAILDPEAIVFGGRIPKELARRIIPHVEIFDDARRAEPRPIPRLMVSETNGDACAIGAAALVFNKRFFTKVG